VPQTAKLVAILAFVLASAACGGKSDHTIDIVFDPCEPLAVSTASSSLTDRRSIEEAVGLWNSLASTQLTLVESGTAAIDIEFVEAFPAHFGLYDDERGVIVVNRNLDEGRTRTITIAHELGHAMGLEHVKASERRSVMMPGNTDTPPGESDRDSLIAIWGSCSPIE
jgi:hypothetical protein